MENETLIKQQRTRINRQLKVRGYVKVKHYHSHDIYIAITLNHNKLILWVDNETNEFPQHYISLREIETRNQIKALNEDFSYFEKDIKELSKIK